MANDWKLSTLEEAGVILIDCVHKTPPAADEGYPYIAIPQIKNGCIDFSLNPRLISHSDYKKWTIKADPKADDIVLSRRCNPGETAYVPQGVEFALGQNLVLLRSVGDKIYSPFLRWLVRGPEWWAQVAKYLNVGAVFDSLRCGEIPRFELLIPPLPEQKAIAHILGSLDDKIELNRQMNETLEAMAQALFKSWFVDFDPVIDNALAAGNAIPAEFFERAEQRKVIEKKDNSDIQALFPDEFEFTEEMGWIPKGWELISFGEFCDIKKGRNITKSTVSEGDIPVVAGGLKPAYYHNKSNVNAPVITVSASGANAGFVNLYYQDIWASDCSYISENMSPFIFTTYSFLKYHQDKVFGLQQGAVQPHVYPKDLSRLNFVDSDVSVKIVIEKNLNSYYEKIKFNEAQTEALAKIRDTLLPKLMSGELNISDAEVLVEEVL